jgi:Protein of unknown function, DUF255
MEVESFENEDVAKLLNDWFVSIKVLTFLLLQLYLDFFIFFLDCHPTSRMHKGMESLLGFKLATSHCIGTD